MKKVLFSFIILITLQAAAQNDPQAIKILDRFSAIASGAPSVSMNFRMITADLAENTSDTLDGSIILRKDKYRLDMGDNIVWFNGETNWNYLTAEKEVTITRPGKKDASFENRPSAIFTMYKSGYKCRLVDDKPGSYLIDLYPDDIKSDLIRVRLMIGKPDMNLISLEYKRRDGVVIKLNFSNWDLTKKPDAATFEFNPEKYRDAEINDMR